MRIAFLLFAFFPLAAFAYTIDLTNAVASIKTNKKIILDNVKVKDSNVRMELKWNSFLNRFYVTKYEPAKVAPGCKSFSYNNACWFTAPSPGMTCNEVCADKGGFDSSGSTHRGNEVGQYFWPEKRIGENWESIECSSIDTDTNWGANGSPADGDWSHPACFVSCACKGAPTETQSPSERKRQARSKARQTGERQPEISK